MARSAYPAPALGSQLTKPSRPLPDGLIVGRAVCGETAWLLTDTLHLVEVSTTRRRVVVHDVRGLDAEDRPWGLACLTDASLWTLSSPRSLARLGQNGQVVERIDLPSPRIALFAWRDRLLFQQLPMVVAAPALATSPPRQPSEGRRWPGLLGVPAPSRDDQLSENLVNCGIPAGLTVPCWFAGERRVSLSDGASARSQSFPFLTSSGVEQTAPIWDLALAGSDRLWLLAGVKNPVTGGRAGGRLIRTDRRGARPEPLDLKPLARVILSATDTSCWLLTVEGQFMEVSVR